MSFNNILSKYRKISFSERDKGARFERLMQAYLLTDPQYAYRFKKVWLWEEFPGKQDLGGGDTGIDLVALTIDGDYWAIQCKCYQETSLIDKPAVDSFLSTSSRTFKNEDLKTVSFSHRLWISTTNKWGPNATQAIKNQHPPVSRIHLHDLQDAPVDWSKMESGVHGEIARVTGRNLRDHQKEALNKTNANFKASDRGKLIMACGTGKTFTSLRIAENETNGNGMILFLVPSIALLGQTLREWSTFANEPINAICICSDPAISKGKNKEEDADTFSTVDLALPASTNPEEILKQLNSFKNKPGMTVVFSTYQSIEVIAKAQKVILQNGFSEFDLIICDEAHRTTGIKIAGFDESAFTKVHDNNFIKAKKRLYMTATPRLYNDEVISRAAQAEAVLYSMDDTNLYGEEIYRIGFGKAVEDGLLTDYKVLILTLNDHDIPPAIQKMIADDNSEISTDDASKLIGCINALSKQVLGDEGIIKDSDPLPMKRAVAFCSNIKVSKKITETYNSASDSYTDSLPKEKRDTMVSIASKHIDGSMSAPERDELLGWLKSDIEEGDCRILTNVRCLSEGVDVPSLDAVLFLSARNSQVDVVQSVGRVMRLSPGKKYGYIIIPVVVPSNITAEKGLDDNERYKVVWTVLNALRAHDDRFNAIVNKIELNKVRPNQIIVGGSEYGFDGDGNPVKKDDSDLDTKNKNDLNEQMTMHFEELQNAIFARMVKKVGDKNYWEVWAKDVAQIAERYMERITKLVKTDGQHSIAFSNFLEGLQKNINPSITENQAIEMLAQHIITKPVFEALFEGYSFVKNNAVSIAMQNMTSILEQQALEKDVDVLQKFYESVKMRAAGIDNAAGKQRIIIELYDKFFKTAFPKMVEQLGIVYTPVECVDFIIHSVNDILQQEFDRSLTDENVHIMDPFTGTGTFITRLLQSGLIKEEDLERKYKHEIHANEIVLLAYYIAAVNIENAFHDATLDPNDGIGKEKYIPYDGICLTDTFQLGESDNSEKIFSEMFPQNSERVQRQKKAPLRVIMGNPPYSIGQKSANDNAQNQSYPILDNRIAKTYAKESNAGLNKSLYDAYIKAFRWSSDRLDPENGGVIAFITNSGWLDGNGSDGFRKILEKEFTSIYVLNLRGSIRGRSGDSAKKEGQNVFDIMTGVAITILVKNPNNSENAVIHYHDIGDYLNRKQKIEILNKSISISNSTLNWNILSPNINGDWLNQRTGVFESFFPMDSENKYDNSTKSYFTTYSLGMGTNRDSWMYNFSFNNLFKNMKNLILFYNEQRVNFLNQAELNNKIDVANFVDNDPTKISWTRGLRNNLKNNKTALFREDQIREVIYRPFIKQKVYYDKFFIESPGQNLKFFPTANSKNFLITISGNGGVKDFYTLMTNCIRDLDTYGGCQCFPLYYYEENSHAQKGLFDTNDKSDYIRRDGVSDFILERAKKQYGKNVTKEDIFYYVYGFLHCPEYREMFTNDLKKMLPRLPLVEDVRDFWKFSKAGRELAELHINYETVPAYDDVVVKGSESEFYTVEKMRFPKKDQKDSIIYNSRISISNIPAEAYEYVVNGKSAIEWVMERYAVTTHKDSGIKNDPNDWATEVENPRYILDLVLSIINVSVQTVEIIKRLPKVKFE